MSPAERKALRKDMPSLLELCRFHNISSERCFKCGSQESLDRAHVIDLSDGGSNLPENLRPLCSLCHAGQPIFHNIDKALEWFNTPCKSPRMEIIERVLKEEAERAGQTLEEFCSALEAERYNRRHAPTKVAA